jgi:PAS domain S-box-containing protein
MNTVIQILHLEDDAADAELVRAKLDDADLVCRINLVRTRRAFGSALHDGGIDIILGDYRLPMYDGMAALEATQEVCPDVPFIFVSGTMGEEAAIAALTRGATDYVLKQNLSRLPTAVCRALQEARNRRRRKEAEQQVVLMSFALNSVHEAAFMIDEQGRFQYVNNAACRLLGYTRAELLTLGVPDINFDFPPEKWPGHWNDLKAQSAMTFEGELTTKDGGFVPVEINANYFEYGGRSYDLGMVRDITERKQAERERLANLRFFESMDSVNRAIQSADDLEAMMKALLDVVMSIFDCDRAYLLYPCDPEAQAWSVPMACNKPEYPCITALVSEMTMDPQTAGKLRTLLAADGPAMFGPGMPYELPEDLFQRFDIQSMMAMAVYPKTGKPWEVGLQQCAYPRAWTPEEERLLQEIGARLEAGLTSMLAYRQLRESEVKYRQIVDTANEGIWVVGPDGLTTFVNARMAEMIGLSGIEMIGRPPSDFMFAEDMPDHKRKMDNRRQGIPGFYERRFRHKDGRTVWTHVSATPIFDEQHGFNGAFAMFTDITENKQVQIRLNEQLLFLQQLIDSIPIPVYYKDEQGLYLGCNAAYASFAGMSRGDIVGKTVHAVVPKARADKHHTKDLELLCHPGVQSYEMGDIYKNGQHRHVIFHKATYVDADDCVAGTVGTIVDITERKQAERERLANLRFFESMDRVNRAIQSADDLEVMMKELLDEVMGIFDCDRAFLLYPCDPGSPTWIIPMESFKPEYPGARESKSDFPMDSQVAEALRILLAGEGPQTFGPGAPHELPEKVSRRFAIKSIMSMAVYPKTGSPWQFGMHQCSYARNWTTEEMRIFEAIGRRLADGLSSLLTYRDLLQNEAFLDKVVEHIPDMLFVKDAQTLSFVRFNKAGEQLVGYPREDMLGKTDYDFFSKEEADFFTHKDRQVLESKELLDIPEEIISNRRQEERILHTKKIPILDENGAPQYLLGISEDITERKRAEEKILRSDQHLRLHREQSPLGFLEFDEDFCILEWNAACERIFGYTRQEAIGFRAKDLILPEEVHDLCDGIYRSLMRLTGGEHSINKNITKDGRIIICEWFNTTLKDKDGNAIGVASICNDITAKMQAEESIRKLSKAVEQSPISIVITDVKGRIEFVNTKFTQITGYAYDEAIGRNPRILQSGKSPVEEYRRLWETISSGGIWQGEFINRKKTGELFFEQATIAPIRDADNVITHYVALKEDISDRKKLEDQLRQVHKMEAIGQMAGGIAHDFNNILSAITGYTELSLSVLKPDSQVFEYLTQVMEASGRAKDLINQILMFSREASQELRPIRIDSPVKEALKLIRATIPPTIEIHSQLMSNVYAVADPTQIHQIVMNLCTNAAYAMKETGGILEVHLTETTADPGDNPKLYPDAAPGVYIRLAVSDQGDGIDGQYIHRIFDPFFTTKKRGEGTGMGLSVVHGIVKSYGGFLYVHSRLGEGSTFEILIPAQKPTAPRDAIAEMAVPTGSESILFVDDETMIVDIIKRMLETLGYRVVARTSGIEALEAFKNNPKEVDLVVTDLTMPKMSGLDLAEEILRIRPGMPILLCTGFDVTMDEKKVAARGLRGIIFKPILRRDMAIMVRNALDNPPPPGDDKPKSEGE